MKEKIQDAWNFIFLECTICLTHFCGLFLIVPWGFLRKSDLRIWLNDLFFFLVLGFGFSSIVRTRRHTSREVSGIGEISISDSATEKEKLNFSSKNHCFQYTNGYGIPMVLVYQYRFWKPKFLVYRRFWYTNGFVIPTVLVYQWFRYTKNFGFQNRYWYTVGCGIPLWYDLVQND